MEEKEKKEEKVEKEEKEIDKKKSSNHNKYAVEIVCLIVLLILLGGCAGWYGNKLFSKSDKNVKEEKTSTTNCLDFYSEPVQEESKEENKEEKPAKVESEWRSIGTDISKVKANYDLLQDYTYSSSRARGGLSFFDEELFEVALRQINENDLTDIEKDANSYVYYAKLSRDKVDSILKKTFGTNYNYDYSLNKNKGVDYKNWNSYRALGHGYLYSALTYEEDTKNFIVYYGGGDGTTGPSPKITKRKVSEVYEKDDMIKVVERVIYLDSFSSSKDIHYSIYANPAQTIYLGYKRFEEEGIENKEINVDEYKEAGVITSIFKKDENGNYIFVSSELSNKPL